MILIKQVFSIYAVLVDWSYGWPAENAALLFYGKIKFILEVTFDDVTTCQIAPCLITLPSLNFFC